MKNNILNFAIDVIVWTILIMNLCGFGGEITQNLCRTIPAFLWMFLIWHTFCSLCMSLDKIAEREMTKKMPQEIKEQLRKIPDKDSALKKYYNMATDLGVIVLFALNGFAGCIVLFVLNWFFASICKKQVRELKEDICKNGKE